MNKKIYKQPSMKVVQLENRDLICYSDPTAFSLNDEEVLEWPESEDPKPKGWGTPW